jgi:hypothetical protein
MKKNWIFLFIFLLSLFTIGCKKSDSSSAGTTDLAANISGTYNGTFTEGTPTFSGTVTIIRINSTTVNVEWIMGGTPGPTLSGISAIDGGSGNITLSGTAFSGSVNGKSLQCSFSGQLNFVGTKP